MSPLAHQPYSYYLGPWLWTTGGDRAAWLPPAGCIGAIDLAKSSEFSKVGSDRGVGFFALTGPVLDVRYTLLGTGDFRSIPTTAVIQSAWLAQTGYSPKGAMLSDLLWDQLTNGSDPLGITACKPLIPDVNLKLQLWVPGHSLVREEDFVLGQHPHSAKVIAVHQQDYWAWRNDVRLRRAKSDHHRRCLSALGAKYKVPNPQDFFIPPGLPKETPLPHQTTINDTFNRADQGGLGTASGGFTYTTIGANTFNISSNQAVGNAANSQTRADSDLSTADNYSQVDVIAYPGGTTGVGLDCRHSSSAYTAYEYDVRNAATLTHRLYKVVAGAFTQLASVDATQPTVTFTAKGQVSGSAVSGLVGGVTTVGPTTDTGVTGNLRTGFGCFNAISTLDNFQGGDVAAAAVVTQPIISEIRQGPPMRGAPFTQILPLTDGLFVKNAVIAWIQGVATQSPNNPVTETFPFNVTAGNFLEVTVATLNLAFTIPATILVTDSLQQTYTQAGPYVTSGSLTLSKWYVPQTLGGPCSVTASTNLGDTSQMLLSANEYRAPALLSLDTTVQGDGGGSPIASAAFVGPVIVTGRDADLVTAGAAKTSSAAHSCTVSPPFLLRSSRLNPASTLCLVDADDVSAFKSESVTFTPDTGTLAGSIALGVAYRFGVPPGQPPADIEVETAPPIRGAPFTQHLPANDSLMVVGVPPPPVSNQPPVSFEIYAGPPMKGVPWQQHIPIENALLYGPRQPPPIPPIVGPGRGKNKPFIERLPDPADERRLSRITEKLSSLLNSLIGQGVIQFTPPAMWTVRSGGFVFPRPPTATDDLSIGATPGCSWIDSAAGQAYICVKNTLNGATWRGPI